MKPQPPPLPPVAPPAVPGEQAMPARKSTLVGGLPWEQDSAAVGSPVVAGMPVVIDDRREGAAAEAYEDPLSWRSLRARFDAFVRRSPPLTVSVSLHVIVLLVLAIWYVRVDPPERVVLDLSFASLTVDEHEEKGVEIPPQPEPVEEPDPEEAKTEEPPVPDPVAAAPMKEEPSEAPGAATAEAAAPVVGSLLEGREEGRRDALVRSFGGSDATEAAVARALEWLVKQQGRDGLWSLQGPYADGGSQENRLAASAMALLALQGAGNTPREGKHRAAVARGWKALLAEQLSDGRFDVVPMPHHHALYSHAQATIALCELYGMTRDEAFEVPARRAIAYAVEAQGPNGGWRYEAGKDGDMSVTGWFLMALKSGEMAGIEIPRQTFAGLESFLDGVAVDAGARYGYRRDLPDVPPVQVTAAVSAEGLLCRQYLGWPRDDKRLVAGVELLLGSRLLDFENDKNLYAWYYITQVTHHMGGEPWDRWNAAMREALPAEQVRRGREAGSWDPSLDKWGHIGGRLYATCFATYMLEVYYRHLPLYAEMK